MALWYYSSGGKAHGPVPEEEVISFLKLGRLTLVDMVFGEGDAEWRMMNEVAIFREALSAHAPAPVTSAIQFRNFDPPPDISFENSGPVRPGILTPLDDIEVGEAVVPEVDRRASLQSLEEAVSAITDLQSLEEVSLANHFGELHQDVHETAASSAEFADDSAVNSAVNFLGAVIEPSIVEKNLFQEAAPVVEASETTAELALEALPVVEASNPPADDVEAVRAAFVSPTVLPIEKNEPSAVTASEHMLPPAYPPVFKASELEPVWVVLRRRDEVFHQSGPYSIEQILQSIGSGEILYTDHVWKPGFKEWTRIGQMPEFDRRRRELEADAMPLPPPHAIYESQAVNEDLNKTVVHFKREEPVLELAPRGTDGVDLISGKAAQIAPKPAPAVLQHQQQPASVTELNVVDYHHEINPEISESLALQGDAPVVHSEKTTPSAAHKQRRQLFIASICAGLALTVGIHILSRPTAGPPETLQPRAMSAQRKKTLLSENKKSSAASANALSSNSSQTEAGNHGPASEPTLNAQAEQPLHTTVAPAEVLPDFRLIGLKLTSDMPSLIVQGPYPVGAKIHVTLKAETGNIIGIPNYVGSAEIQRHEGEIASADLASMRLPAGVYNVQVTSDGIPEQESTLFIGHYEGGKSDPQFLADHEAYLKSIARESTDERRAMYYVTLRFELLTKSLSAGYLKFHHDNKRWKAFYTGWQRQALQAASPINGFAHRPKSELIYPSDILEIQTSTTTLMSHARTLNVAIAQKRDVASESPVSADDFRSLRKRAANLTSRHLPEAP